MAIGVNMKITQLQSKESIFIPQIGGLGNTVNHGSAGAKFQDLKLEVLDNAGVKVSVKKPGTEKRYFAVVPWGTIKAATGEDAEPISPKNAKNS